MKLNQRKAGAILSYISIFANTIVQLLYTPFLVGKLGQSEYGLYSLVSSIIGYLTILDLGFGNAIVVHTAKYRAIGDKKKEQTLHGMFHFIYIAIGVIAGVIGCIVALNSGNIFGATMSIDEVQKMKTMLFILSFNLFMTFAFSIYNAIITASEKFIFQKTLAIISTIAKPLLMIPVLFMGYKSIALCLIITAVNILVLFLNYYFCKKKMDVKIRFNGFDKALFKTIFAYSFWIFLGVIADKINWSADQTILGIFCGTIAISIYSIAATINTLFINLSTAISGVMLPKMSKMVAKNATKEELSDELIKVGRMQYYIVFLMASGFVLFGKEFIRLWVGEGFEEAYRVALLLVIPLCIPLIQNLGLSILQAMNKFKFRTILMSVMSIANIIATVFLVQWKGATGAAIGTAGSLIICNVIIMNIYYRRVIGLDIFRFWKNIIGMTIKFSIPVIVVMALTLLVKINGLLSFTVSVLAYSAIFAINAYLLCANEYEKKIVKRIAARMHLVK